MQFRANYFSHDVKKHQIAKHVVKDNKVWKEEKRREMHETHFYERKFSTFFVS
jgi:hypothetical protein